MGKSVPVPGTEGISSIITAFNGRLFFSVSLIALSQFNFGYDTTVFGTTQAMAPFTRRFGHLNPKTHKYAIEPYFLSYLNSFPFLGFAFGLVTGSIISRKFGRRTCVIVMCAWAVIAASIVVSSQHREQLLAGRVLAYIYIGMELAVVPVYQSELVPARVRGFVVGTYQSGLLIGGLIASVICRGTSDIKDDASWRIPMGLFFVVPTIVGTLAWFIPESPRWYLSHGRSDEALVSLRKLRRGRFSEEEILHEFADLQTISSLPHEKAWFIEMFQGTNLRRTLIAVGTSSFLQLTGQNFVSAYGTIYVQSLHTINPFTFGIVSSVISIVTVFLTQYLSDRAGRRPLMIAGSLVQMGSLFAMGGLGIDKVPSYSARQGITAMVAIFGAGFCLGWAPLSHLITAEVPSSRLRDQTYALASVFNVAIQFAVSFSIPYLLYAPYANLGSKVGFIFGSIATCALIFSYLCIPELKNRTLEEVDWLFVQGTPIRKFGTAKADIPPVDDVLSAGSLKTVLDAPSKV
ncbi:hypothetical protein A1O3_07172 [Capronia epimyces CBS 606.96]|uniref:Major facilitator superfamily (MFS) profile domain-containing protein n=1 Tax=Capronia epimyces CBS 606.96 TaxID=1182542 RepID=W9YF20_9EURO|nr:uncharacterized protein A1O3_07172 [Capronia epimyces CBS 606.96]EXJ80884.1 hypothetical protein A1O3_07172 [Capronia epimyces CBS 606.96]